ncbi:hypothetical protein Clacol_006911 [Clathrus columnatus]|uniref:Uncharacterized protein n=1 Tax=Clathrus columnatus TaxID=1419009 RepID=A0AAV5AG07_9AGAM|nr:hypothetical protein Clacol_006911 [Clathrus columnatus]
MWLTVPGYAFSLSVRVFDKLFVAPSFPMEPNKQPAASINRTDELECLNNPTLIRQPQESGFNERFSSVQKNTLNPILTPSSLQQLMKHTLLLYHGSLVSISSSHSPPYVPGGNCDKLQHDLLIATLVVAFVSAFASVFARKYKYDSSGKDIIYPPPKGFTVTTQITDPNINATFPCKAKNGQYCWPVFDSQGNFIYDETQGLLALLLKDGTTIEVGERSHWFQLKKRPKIHTDQSPGDAIIVIGNDAVASQQLQPFWRRSVVGIKGAKYYLDFHRLVWAQASISVLAFGTLSMFSSQVGKCLYPNVSEYILSAIQTFLFLLIGAITAFVMPDDSTEVSELFTQQFALAAEDEDDNIPMALYNVVERIVRIKKVSDDTNVEAS